MRKRFSVLALAPLLLATPGWAQDMLGPLDALVDQFTQGTDRPRAAPDQETELAPVPRPRPPDVPVVERPVAPAVEDEAEDAPDASEAEPDDDRVYQAACPAVVMGLVEGAMAPPLSEESCGERSPLTVTAVMSRGRMVPLSSPVTTNCQMATQLPDWVQTADGYATAMLESAVATVDVGTSYMCRARNGGDENRMSEHGFANALDVAGFTLEDGTRIGVAEDWADAEAPAGRLLRLAHDAACASFMTVLGPEANREHEDHLHLDMGCHGEMCEARICE